MLQYLDENSITRHTELHAFLEETNPEQYAVLAAKLTHMYELEFLVPKHVLGQMFPSKRSSIDNSPQTEQRITKSEHIESVIACLGGLEKLKALLGDNLSVRAPIRDFYLSAALVGSEAHARDILLHLKSCREIVELKEIVMEQVATALFSCDSLEHGRDVIGLLNVIYDSVEMRACLAEMKTIIDSQATFVMAMINNAISVLGQRSQTDALERLGMFVPESSNPSEAAHQVRPERSYPG